ncbi:MAG TPA: PASTA domain-containing protein [Candidatus Kryptonia bacterium]
MNSKVSFISRLLWSNLARKFYLALVILIFLFSLMNWIVMPWYVKGSGIVTVPELTGLTMFDAKTALDSLGLQLQLGGMKPSKLPSNTVLSQNPESGTTVKRGRRVYLIVSGGVEKSSVPDLRGRSEREAQFMLERGGFKLGDVTSDTSSNLPQDVVISQSIPPNTVAAAGTQVSLLVSAGAPESGEVSVPNIVGKPLSEAQRIISNNNLQLGKITFQPSRKLVPNTVLEQYPRAEEFVQKGTKVDLFVSSISNQKQGPEN